MDLLSHELDLYLPNIRDDFVGDQTEKDDSEVIVYNLFIVLYCFTCANSSIEDQYELFIAVRMKVGIKHSLAYPI